MLSGIIEKGISNKEFRADWNSADFATVLFAMLEGGHLIARMSGNNDRMIAIGKHSEKMIRGKQGLNFFTQNMTDRSFKIKAS
nr:hypothetical protein [Chryseobacterium sp. CH1]